MSNNHKSEYYVLKFVLFISNMTIWEHWHLNLCVNLLILPVIIMNVIGFSFFYYASCTISYDFAISHELLYVMRMLTVFRAVWLMKFKNLWTVPHCQFLGRIEWNAEENETQQHFFQLLIPHCFQAVEE